jgi:hypothetical protein
MSKQQRTVFLTAVITTLIVIIGFIALMPSLGPRFLHPMLMGDEPVPTDLDTSSARPSEAGLYQVSWQSDTEGVPLNQIHSWTVHVETADGQPVENASILVDGGMPQHGHGLPTSPKVTEYLGDGDYRVEGLRFQMTGFWEVKFTIHAENQSDSVTFNLTLP